MKLPIDYRQLPKNFVYCLHDACPHSGECLRRRAAEVLPADCHVVKAVNPNLRTSEGECPYYRPAVVVRNAYGMIGLLGNLPYKDALSLTYDLKAHFGHSLFYRMRKGEVPISPARQEIIVRKIRAMGLGTPAGFDRYAEEYDW